MTALAHAARPTVETQPGAALARIHLAFLYRWRHGRWPDLDRPRRFTEWVQWRKLHDRCPDRALLTDKSHSKRVAAEILGNAMVVPTLWTGCTLPAEPRWPMPFVVKANHGCGQFIVVRDRADWARARVKAPRWVASRYGAALCEWHYAAAAPGLIVEPYFGGPNALAVDFKIYVFGGRAEMVQVHAERARHHRWSQFDRNWQLLSRTQSAQGKPASLDAMIAASERLGAGHDFLRVDFYEVEGRPLFGEFCLFPGSGLDPFDPVSLDDELGRHWRVQSDSVASGRLVQGGDWMPPSLY
ncbi:MAG: polysaccharide biosynthesis protein [Pseudomonadota bacterium]|nr:polysaccharide biosynthesis protein [Pseudomonadota bacterium]